jgi:ketosteroid isomerase-like protein
MPADLDYAAVARQFVEAVARGADEEVTALLADDVQQEEFPNRLLPSGTTRDRAAMREAGERGKRVLARQRYEMLNVVAAGEHVALEARWTGTLAVPVGALPAGGEMRARFAMFFEFKCGKIWRVRNYDCFEPW